MTDLRLTQQMIDSAAPVAPKPRRWVAWVLAATARGSALPALPYQRGPARELAVARRRAAASPRP